MSTGGVQRFGLVQARAMQGVFALLALIQTLQAVSGWRQAGGLDGMVVVSVCAAVLSAAVVVIAPWSVVRVGDGRIAWAVGVRRHDLAFEEVADIRQDPRWWGASQLVTTDGRVLRLPLQPHHGAEVWHLVLGDRTPSAA